MAAPEIRTYLQEKLEKSKAEVEYHQKALATAQQEVALCQKWLNEYQDITEQADRSETTSTHPEILGTLEDRQTSTEARNNNGNHTKTKTEEEKTSRSSSKTMKPAESGLEPLKVRTPIEMIKPEFKGMTINKIAQKILREAAPEELTNAQITKLVYDTSTEEEFSRCRGAISAVLREEAGKWGWAKLGPNKYVWVGEPETTTP